MQKWRRISLIGVILGIAMTGIDSLVEGVPYAITIPVELASVVLIFAGLIIRKREKTCDK